MGILTGIKNILQRNSIAESEEQARQDLLKQNRNKLEALQLVDNNPNNDKIKNEKY